MAKEAYSRQAVYFFPPDSPSSSQRDMISTLAEAEKKSDLGCKYKLKAEQNYSAPFALSQDFFDRAKCYKEEIELSTTNTDLDGELSYASQDL